MNQLHGRYFLVLVLTALLSLPKTSFAAEPIVEQLQEHWEATRNQIATIAEAVPEDKYDYRPTPEVRTFRELLVHIITENYTFMGRASGVQPQVPPGVENLKTRAAILQALSASYDYGEKVLAGMTDQKLLDSVPFLGGRQVTRLFAIVANMKDNHEHYGNLVTYLRLNGIVPPRTAARQQR